MATQEDIASNCKLDRAGGVRPLIIAGGVGYVGAVLIGCMSAGAFERLLHSALLTACFFVSVALGGLFFVILQHLTYSRWSAALRRVAELLTATLPWGALLFTPLLLLLLAGDSRLYPWNDETLRSTDALIQGKAAYLNAPFFVLRTIFYFGVWSLLIRFFLRQSLAQDRLDNDEPTRVMRKWSGPAMMIFALTVCFAAFDWLMSLEPHWFSSIFGVYFFSGAVVGFLAAFVLATRWLDKVGGLEGVVTTEHYHDLGKLLFGFTFFWAYIAFSQYLLIWYANIPEETMWFAARQESGWQWISLWLVGGHFVLPFLGLMSRSAKRRPNLVVFWAGWLLVMHWIDLYWLVMPQVSPGSFLPAATDLLLLIGGSCLFVAAWRHVAGRRLLVAVGDPELQYSLAYHNH